jgi:hypothetical protein
LRRLLEDNYRDGKEKESKKHVEELMRFLQFEDINDFSNEQDLKEFEEVNFNGD